MLRRVKYLTWKKVIWKSELFDVEYYLFTYPDVRIADIDPIMHYLKFGADEGRNPSPHFNSQQYQRDNMDVSKSSLNPLYHYITYGYYDKRSINTDISNPMFELKKRQYYRFLKFKLLTSISNPRNTLKLIYQYFKIKQSKLFDKSYYKKQYPKWISKTIKMPLLHYILNSWKNSADPFKEFDSFFYTRQRTGLTYIIQKQRISPLYHYINFGTNEGLNPNRFFNTSFYKSVNKDVKGMLPFYHYLNFGRDEGRAATHNDLIAKIKNNSMSNPFFSLKDTNTFSTLVNEDYNNYFNKTKCNKHTYNFQKNYKFKYNPLISIIVPVYNPDQRIFIEMLESVVGQSYGKWELCISNSSTDDSIIRIIKDYSKTYSNIKYIHHNVKLGISENSNFALELCTGEYVGLLDHDDLLTVDGLFEVVNRLNSGSSIDIIYSDEDKVTEDSKIFLDPFFKPDWSPDTLMSIMYTCHFTVYRTSLIKNLKGFRKEFDGAQDYDLMLRSMEKTNKIEHIPQILYHWRISDKSIASGAQAKNYAVKALRKTKLAALERRGLEGELIKSTDFPGQYTVKYSIKKESLISIIIPTKDKKDILEVCIESIINKTQYKNYEIIIIDNNSQEQETFDYYFSLKKYKQIEIFKFQSDFNFSAINNYGVSLSQGEYILFLNNDTEIIQDDWLDHLLGYAQLSHVGAVGAQLLYPDSNSIQHCGVLNLIDGPSHAFHNFPSKSIYHFGRNSFEYNWLAVTGACLLVQKETFLEIGGYDESFPIGYNDIDLCFRFYKNGFYNVSCNSVKLIHHESISRGHDSNNLENINRLEKEKQQLYQKHPDLYQMDPFYNINLHPVHVDFTLRDIL